MSYKIKKDGEWVTVANGSRMFVGTTAAIDAAIARGELKYPDLYAATDDYPTTDKSYKLSDITVNSDYATMRTQVGMCTRVGNILYCQFELNVTNAVPDNGHLFTLPDGLKGAGIILTHANNAGYSIYSSGVTGMWYARGNIPKTDFLSVVGNIVLV